MKSASHFEWDQLAQRAGQSSGGFVAHTRNVNAESFLAAAQLSATIADLLYAGTEGVALSLATKPRHVIPCPTFQFGGCHFAEP